MSRALRISLVVLLLLSVASLAALVVLRGGSSLDGTRWRLSEWSVSSLAPSDFTITANLADGQILGTSAVNSYGGTYRTGPGGSFSTGDINATAMAGPEDAMRAEQIYFELLEQVARYSREGGTLTLADENANPLLVFTLGE